MRLFALFLANCAHKIPNYANCTIFLNENFFCFKVIRKNVIKKQTEVKRKNIADFMNAEKMTESVEELIRDLRAHENNLRDIYEVEQKQHAIRLENLELITTPLESHCHSPLLLIFGGNFAPWSS